MLSATPVLYHALMAEPTQEDIDRFNAAVDAHIEGRAAEGVTLSRDDAVKQIGNLLKNLADDPEGTEKKFKAGDRLNTVEERLAVLEDAERVANLEDRVAHLEDISGGTNVAEGKKWG